MENMVEEPAISLAKPFSSQEYLDMPNPVGVRYEYWEGELFAMAGTTTRHNEIIGNLFNSLRRKTRKRGCKVFFTDINVSLK